MSLTVSYVAMKAYFPNAGNTLALTGIKSKCTYILPFGPISVVDHRGINARKDPVTAFTFPQRSDYQKMHKYLELFAL